VWLVSDTEVNNDLNSAYSNMASKLGMPLFAATGNHDAAPVNSFPPNTINTTISSQYVYDALSADWKQWIGASAAAQADQYGAYSYKVPNLNIKIISFNTNFYYKENFWLYEATLEYDPNGQLAWLVSELQAAETAGQRVYLIGHMPMGANDAFHDGSNYFGQILNRYDATISANFFGHTHRDEFQIGYSNYKSQSAQTANSMSYIAPALTPTSGSPAFRVYSVDPVTFGVLDMTEYSTSLEASTYQTTPVWSKYYSVKEAYGPLVSPPVTAASAELTPAFWHNLTTVFQNNDAVFQQFNARKSRGYNVQTCTGDCKNSTICQLRAAEAQYNCATVSPGIDFKKRDLADSDSHSQHSECHGSKLKEILSSIAGGSV
jgi:sphingomyelin phosphodiesterase